MTLRLPRFLLLSAARVRNWLRLLLLCSAFSAVHGPLGAWVVSSVSDGPAVQICTPQGLQWVSTSLDDSEEEHQASALQHCVWAAAHVAITPPVTSALTAAPPGCPPVAGPDRGMDAPNDLATRVLLMSAMRAPPLPA